jgi:hypothetical protein
MGHVDSVGPRRHKLRPLGWPFETTPSIPRRKQARPFPRRRSWNARREPVATSTPLRLSGEDYIGAALRAKFHKRGYPFRSRDHKPLWWRAHHHGSPLALPSTLAVHERTGMAKSRSRRRLWGQTCPCRPASTHGSPDRAACGILQVGRTPNRLGLRERSGYPLRSNPPHAGQRGPSAYVPCHPGRRGQV